MLRTPLGRALDAAGLFSRSVSPNLRLMRNAGTIGARRGAQDRPDRPNAGLSLLSSIIALGALIVGVYGSGAFDQYGGKKQIIATIVIHALPAISLTRPALLLRVYGLWFGIFLIASICSHRRCWAMPATT
jgi:hypothetical protein